MCLFVTFHFPSLSFPALFLCTPEFHLFLSMCVLKSVFSPRFLVVCFHPVFLWLFDGPCVLPVFLICSPWLYSLLLFIWLFSFLGLSLLPFCCLQQFWIWIFGLQLIFLKLAFCFKPTCRCVWFWVLTVLRTITDTYSTLKLFSSVLIRLSLFGLGITQLMLISILMDFTSKYSATKHVFKRKCFIIYIFIYSYISSTKQTNAFNLL